MADLSEPNGFEPFREYQPTKLDFGEFVMDIRPDGKIVFIEKGNPYHWTLHLGGKSGILDVHVTVQGANPTHQTLGGVRVEDVKAFIRDLVPGCENNLQRFMHRILRRVRLSWLAHRRIYVFPAVFEKTALPKFGTRRGKQWTVDKVRLADVFSRPLPCVEVEQSPEMAFSLVRPNHTQGLYGVLFKIPGPGGRYQYLWMKSSRLWNEMRAIWKAYEPEVRARLLTPDEVVAAIGKS